MNGRKGKDAKRQHMQSPPPAVANALAQQGADADSDADVQRHNTERHPLGAIVARERDKNLVPPEVGERVDNDSQNMYSKKDRAEQR